MNNFRSPSSGCIEHLPAMIVRAIRHTQTELRSPAYIHIYRVAISAANIFVPNKRRNEKDSAGKWGRVRNTNFFFFMQIDVNWWWCALYAHVKHLAIAHSHCRSKWQRDENWRDEKNVSCARCSVTIGKRMTENGKNGEIFRFEKFMWEAAQHSASFPVSLSLLFHVMLLTHAFWIANVSHSNAGHGPGHVYAWSTSTTQLSSDIA